MRSYKPNNEVDNRWRLIVNQLQWNIRMDFSNRMVTLHLDKKKESITKFEGRKKAKMHHNQIDHMPHFQWQFKSIASRIRGVVNDIADKSSCHYETQKCNAQQCKTNRFTQFFYETKTFLVQFFRFKIYRSWKKFTSWVKWNCFSTTAKRTFIYHFFAKINHFKDFVILNN